jgi:hypothetical protein
LRWFPIREPTTLGVSAFAAEMRMTLSCLEVKGGNEIEAALEVLGLIDLKGKICSPLSPQYGGKDH